MTSVPSRILRASTGAAPALRKATFDWCSRSPAACARHRRAGPMPPRARVRPRAGARPTHWPTPNPFDALPATGAPHLRARARSVAIPPPCLRAPQRGPARRLHGRHGPPTRLPKWVGLSARAPGACNPPPCLEGRGLKFQATGPAGRRLRRAPADSALLAFRAEAPETPRKMGAWTSRRRASRAPRPRITSAIQCFRMQA